MKFECLWLQKSAAEVQPGVKRRENAAIFVAWNCLALIFQDLLALIEGLSVRTSSY
jgi:hypothetical protein